MRRRIPSYLIRMLLILLAYTPSVFARSYTLVTLEYPPYEYTENGQVKGIAVEIVREAFRLMGHEAVIQVYPFKRSIEMFKRGEADAIFTFFKTPEREEFTLYSNEVVVLQSITLWVRQDSPITYNDDFSSMSQYHFGVIRGVSYGEKFDAQARAGKLNLDTVDSASSAMDMLVASRFDIWVSNHFGAVYELKRAGLFESVKELTPPVQEQLTYVGFSKVKNLGELRDQFDKTLKILKRNGFYDAVLDKYRHSMKYR
jgi:polar amino acid transport system substrate-binding protein